MNVGCIYCYSELHATGCPANRETFGELPDEGAPGSLGGEWATEQLITYEAEARERMRRLLWEESKRRPL